jgi:NAD(P)-dependent dehydrogenase (short-subunit alcohol dehydrogenase family)
MGSGLEDRVGLITGAGSGVGREMAKLFAERGCKVVVVDVIPERVNQVVSEIGTSGGKATGMVLDLSLESEVERMVEDSFSAYGKIDILCNNAGIMDGVKPVAETSDELWEGVLNINLNAPFWASRRVIPIMLKQGNGIILNTASVAGVFGGKAGAAYTVSKHGLIGLTKSIAASYGAKGIRCNAMVLGAVQTAIGVGSKEPSPLGMDILNKTAALIPRMAEPKEIAQLALFLASDDSSYLNGSCVVADGGWTIY